MPTVLPSSTHRLDPYKNFKFRIKRDGSYVAAISKIDGLKRTHEASEYRKGGDPSSSSRSPGRSKYEAITLERGVTHNTAFQQWASASAQQSSAEAQTGISRMDIIIDEYNEAGQQVQAYKVFGCWISEYQAMPDLDAGSNAVAIQHIKLENEGWQSDSPL